MRFLLLILLCACSLSQETLTKIEGTAMTMPYQVTIGKKLRRKDKKKIQALINSCFSHIDQTFNPFNPYSEISQINQTKSAVISSEMKAFVHLVNEMHELTDKRFDPTLQKDHPIPSFDQINIEKQTLIKPLQTKLDFCGIAKGHAVDLIFHALKKEGFENFLVEWSGEMRASGLHPLMRPWRVKIFGAKKNVLLHSAIATSGNYVFNWKKEGKTYAHIIDGTHKSPITLEDYPITSVTCLAPTCAEADALATAAMTFKSYRDFQIWSRKITSHNPHIAFFILSLP